MSKKEARTGSIDMAIMARFKKVAGSQKEALEIFDMVLPTLQDTIKEDILLQSLLKEVNSILHERQLEMEAKIGHIHEAKETVQQAQYDIAAVETFQDAKHIYESSDVQTIIRLLDNFGEGPLEDALVLCSQTEFDKVGQALQSAQLRRENLD